METTNKLTPNEEIFFNSLRSYLNLPIYFYGSILRSDYIPGKSDIDIAIFSDNETSTIHMLCSYLNLTKSDFEKTITNTNDKNIIRGYKTNYDDTDNHLNVEISIFNEKHKIQMLKEQNTTNLPFYLVTMLFFLKYFYYNLNLIDKKTYNKYKRLIMNKPGSTKFIVYK